MVSFEEQLLLLCQECRHDGSKDVNNKQHTIAAIDFFCKKLMIHILAGRMAR